MQFPTGRPSAPPLLPIVLIALGLAMLIGNVMPAPARGGVVVLSIGLAFLVARVVTGRYGYAVPSGVLLGLGSFALSQPVLRRAGGFAPRESGGLFFVALGLGFVAIYAIGWRRARVWPVFPGLVMLAVGAMLFAASYAWPLAPLAWMGGYWPVVLILVGGWLLVRDRLPRALHRPVATVGVVLIVACALLAATAVVGNGLQ